MKESNVIECMQYEQNKVIHDYEQFGWVLISSQTIDYVDSSFHMQTVGNTTYNWNTKNRTQYVSLTFQRDKEMKNYAEIKNLDDEYFDLKNKMKREFAKMNKFYEEKGRFGTFLTFSIISFITHFVCVIIGSAEGILFLIFLSLLILGLGFFLLVMAIKNKEKIEKLKNEAYQIITQKYTPLINEIIEKSLSLM